MAMEEALEKPSVSSRRTLVVSFPNGVMKLYRGKFIDNLSPESVPSRRPDFEKFSVVVFSTYFENPLLYDLPMKALTGFEMSDSKSDFKHVHYQSVFRSTLCALGKFWRFIKSPSARRARKQNLEGDVCSIRIATTDEKGFTSLFHFIGNSFSNISESELHEMRARIAKPIIYFCNDGEKEKDFDTELMEVMVVDRSEGTMRFTFEYEPVRPALFSKESFYATVFVILVTMLATSLFSESVSEAFEPSEQAISTSMSI